MNHRHVTPAAPFIVLEGGEGAGKSTQAQLLADRLDREGVPVLLTRQPGGSEVGQAVREVLLHGSQLDARTEALLFAADRAQHVATVISPALSAGRVVVCDRYADSSLAYQCGGRRLDSHVVSSISSWAARGLVPDLTILLDVDSRTRHERLSARAADRIEREDDDFHERIRQTFLALARDNADRYLVLDAGWPPHETAQLVWQRVRPMLRCDR